MRPALTKSPAEQTRISKETARYLQESRISRMTGSHTIQTVYHVRPSAFWRDIITSQRQTHTQHHCETCTAISSLHADSFSSNSILILADFYHRNLQCCAWRQQLMSSSTSRSWSHLPSFSLGRPCHNCRALYRRNLLQRLLILRLRLHESKLERWSSTMTGSLWTSLTPTNAKQVWSENIMSGITCTSKLNIDLGCTVVYKVDFQTPNYLTISNFHVHLYLISH